MKITDSQQNTAVLKPVTAGGKPAAVEPGSILWSGPSFAALTPSADGLSVTVVAMGVGGLPEGAIEGDPGEEYVSVSADADLGAGVVTISGKFALRVVASQAQSLGFEFGTPTEQVAAGPTPNPA
jgi:hypothetical protein